MKKITFLTLFFSALSLALYAQKITYKANKWGDTKLHKDWATSLDNPILEKVVILQTSKMFKISFGSKRTLTYTILSSEKQNPNAISYSVKSNGKNYSIEVMFIGSSYYILCKDEWAVGEIKDMSTSD